MAKNDYSKLNATLIQNLNKKINELKESENRFRIIFENAGDGILAADANTKKFVIANPRMSKITGYTKNELFQLGVEDIHPKKDLPYVIDQFTKQMQGKIVVAENLPVLRKDKKVIYCDVSSVPAKIDGKELLIGFFRDMTKRKKAEDELKLKITKLEGTIKKIKEKKMLKKYLLCKKTQNAPV